MAAENLPSRTTRQSIKNQDCTLAPTHCLSSINRGIFRTVFVPNHFTNMFKMFHDLQKKSEYCDVMIMCTDGHLFAHRLVLVVASPELQKLIGKSPERNGVSQVVMSNRPFQVIEKIVTFLYTGSLKFKKRNLPELIKQCEYLGLRELVNKLKASVDLGRQDEETNENGENCNGMLMQKYVQTTQNPVLNVVSVSSTIKSENPTCTEAPQTESLDSSKNIYDSDSTISCEEFQMATTVKKRKTIDGDQLNEICTLKKEFRSYSGEIEVNDSTNSAPETSNQNMNENFEEYKKMCSVCEEEFENEKDFKAHKKICKLSKPRRKCMLCNKVCETAAEYSEHRQTDTACLTIQSERRNHKLQHRRESRKKFLCRVCPRKFRRVSDHVEHEFLAHEMMYDTDEYPDLTCEWCGYKTMNPWRLHHHQKYDCGKGQDHICDICGNNYRNEKTLKHHKYLVHTDQEPWFTCEKCGKRLKGRKGLAKHIRLVHNRENIGRKHMCHVCSMKYSKHSDLLLHLYKVHDQPLPDDMVVYRCQQCDYISNNKRTFTKHEELHLETRDFKCETCSKRFKTRGGLTTHVKIHKSERIPCPYENCTYAGLKKNHLKAHIANQHTHKGAKPQQCHLCEYGTFFKGNLIKHQRTVHNLEIVTRHTVNMKAKYKNYKNGDIVGIAAEKQKKKKPGKGQSKDIEKQADIVKNQGENEKTVNTSDEVTTADLIENQAETSPVNSVASMIEQNKPLQTNAETAVNSNEQHCDTAYTYTYTTDQLLPVSNPVMSFGFPQHFVGLQTDFNIGQQDLDKTVQPNSMNTSEQSVKLMTYYQM